MSSGAGSSSPSEIMSNVYRRGTEFSEPVRISRIEVSIPQFDFGTQCNIPGRILEPLGSRIGVKLSYIMRHSMHQRRCNVNMTYCIKDVIMANGQPFGTPVTFYSCVIRSTNSGLRSVDYDFKLAGNGICVSHHEHDRCRAELGDLSCQWKFMNVSDSAATINFTRPTPPVNKFEPEHLFLLDNAKIRNAHYIHNMLSFDIYDEHGHLIEDLNKTFSIIAPKPENLHIMKAISGLVSTVSELREELASVKKQMAEKDAHSFFSGAVDEGTAEKMYGSLSVAGLREIIDKPSGGELLSGIFKKDPAVVCEKLLPMKIVMDASSSSGSAVPLIEYIYCHSEHSALINELLVARIYDPAVILEGCNPDEMFMKAVVCRHKLITDMLLEKVPRFKMIMTYCKSTQ